MGYNETNQMIEEYRKRFKNELDIIMKKNGHDFESAYIILESALDFAESDLRNEIYK